MPLRLLALLAGLLGPLLSLAPPAAAASWVWPLAGPPPVVRAFAPGPADWSPGHRGVDLAGVPGEPVLAAGAGQVSYAGLLAGRGVVTVVHGGLRTTYEPVSTAVRVGHAVAAGEELGTLDAGHPGCPVAACLHWGLLRGDTYLDPLSLVRPVRVRLLPPDSSSVGTASAAGPSAVQPAQRVQVGGPPPAAVLPAPVGHRQDPPAPPLAPSGAPAPPGRRTALVVTGGALLVTTAGVGRRRRGS